MKKLYVLTGAAVLTALIISFAWQPMSFEERIIHIQAEQAPPALAAALKDEPVEVKAVVLDYTHDPVLQLKAQAALLAHPELARKILTLYGDEPEFKQILRRYGEAILPSIEYYLRNDVYSVRMMHYTARMTEATKQAAAKLRSEYRGTDIKAEMRPQQEPLTPEMRGWYAVNFIHEKGHGFLGQFVMAPDGEPKRLQSERFLEGANSFFAGGVRSLESKFKLDEEIAAGDIGWATVDVLFVASAVKLLRIGRAAAASGKSLSLSTRAAAFGSRMARVGRLGMRAARYAKWPAVLVTAYVAVKHPGVINDTLAGLAKLVGVPEWVGQFVGWSILLLPLLWLAQWIFRLLLRPAIALLGGAVRLLSWAEQRLGKRRSVAVEPQEPVAAQAPAT